MNTASGSFRDPSGQVFQDGAVVCRTINESYKHHWEKAEPFLKAMADQGLVLPFEEVTALPQSWKTIQVERLPFVSYPYEWSFDQLKDAALLTLSLQKQALLHGLILKDASAYNVQFIGSNAIFIDHLSFEVWNEGEPWGAYRQFCSHFIAPLALMAAVDLRCGIMSSNWIDGIPLDLAAAMMPKKKKLNPGLNFHLFLHADMQNKYSDVEKSAEKAKRVKVTLKYLTGLADSLERLIESRTMQPPKVITEWGDYYNHTNYTADAANEKLSLVAESAKHYQSSGPALDLGANTGQYSRAVAPYFSQVIAADVDPLAVNRHYLTLKNVKDCPNVLPLLIDFSNPSADIGFMNTERTSFIRRGRADFVIALALIHHLRITAGIPLYLIADFMAELLNPGGILLLEFVPREDSQTQKLLALREDIFTDYSLEQCQQTFSRHFECLSVRPVSGSCRSILTLKKERSSYER